MTEMPGSTSTPPRRRGSRVLRWIGRGVLGLIALLLVLIGGGAAYLWHVGNRGLEPVAQPVGPSLLRYADEIPVPARAEDPAGTFDWTTIAAPPRQAMPWVRWWWPGGDVEPAELERELAVMKAANFGGAEIQPFNVGTARVIEADPAARARVMSVDTPRYFARVRAALASAQRLGLRLDLSNYSGWPAGNPLVSSDLGNHSLEYATLRVSGGKPLDLVVPRPRPSLSMRLMALISRFAGGEQFAAYDPARATLLTIVAAHPGQGPGLFAPFRTQDLDPAGVQVLDRFVRDGRLRWTAPPGDWVIVASWLMPTGEQVTGQAFAGPARVVDLLNARALRAHNNYAFGARAGISVFQGRALRGVFNDSLEIKADRLSSADFLDEFQRRRGYDPRPYLPSAYRPARDNSFLSEALPVEPSFGFGAPFDRVREDYQQTLSDLFIERYAAGMRAWTEPRGLLSRFQTYGLDIDTIRAGGANDIPETEQLYGGGSDGALHVASSAALLYGRQLVSSESFVWPAKDYAVNPAMLKAGADKMFAAGVNHIVYHGFPYDWRRADRGRFFPATGWDPFSRPDLTLFSCAGNFSDRAAIWQALPAFNIYVARAQNLLRQGRPHADVLIYYPFLGYPAPEQPVAGEALVAGRFPLAGTAGSAVLGIESVERPRELWLRKVLPLTQALSRRGLTWGWVNGDALRTQLLPGRRLRRGATYGALVFADVPMAQPADLAAARRLQTQGTRVFMLGEVPQRQPGLANRAQGDATVRRLAAEIAAGSAMRDPARFVASRGAGTASLAFDRATPIRRASRMLAGAGRIDFFANTSTDLQAGRIIADGLAGAWWFDALTGRAWPAVTDTTGRLPIELSGWQSRFLIRGVTMPAGLASPAPGGAATRQRVLHDWTLRLGQRVWRRGLFAWEKDEALRTAGGIATYRTVVDLDRVDAGARHVLALGPVPGIARVRVNGRLVQDISLPPFTAALDGHLRPGRNLIEILYRPTERNAMIAAAKAGDARLAHFKKRSEETIPAGLRGPARLLEYR